MSRADRRAVVLVHGAWHGGWCWRRVMDRLLDAGHRVLAPTLTGLGERVHLRDRGNDLELHVRDILAVLHYEDLDDVVLCGHSYAGMVITAVADRMPERLHCLVYLDAYVPADGQSVLDIRPQRQNEALLERVREEGEGWLMPPTPAATFGVENAEDRRWLDTHCVPMPLRCFEQRIRLLSPAAPHLLRHYVRAARNDNEAFCAHYERFRDDAAWTVHEVDCGHEIMVDRSDWLAALLVEVASTP